MIFSQLRWCCAITILPSLIFTLIITKSVAAEKLVPVGQSIRKNVLIMRGTGNYACLATKPKNRFGRLTLRRGTILFRAKNSRLIIKSYRHQIRLLSKEAKLSRIKKHLTKLHKISQKIAAYNLQIKSIRSFVKRCRTYTPIQCTEFASAGICLTASNGGSSSESNSSSSSLSNSSSSIGLNTSSSSSISSSLNSFGSSSINTSSSSSHGNSSSAVSSSTSSVSSINSTPAISFRVNDLAVTNSGRSVVVGSRGDYQTYAETWMACFNPDLSQQGREVLVNRDTRNADQRFSFKVENPVVAVSRVTGNGAILIATRNPDGATNYKVAFIDNTCSVTRLTTLSENYIGDPYHDIDADDAGRIALTLWAYNAGQRSIKLYQFSEVGEQIAVNFLFSSPQSSANHVALNKITGDGIVSVQGHFDGPVTYRRFAANGNWIDSQFIAVAESDRGNSSWYDSHAVSILSDGRVGIIWQNSRYSSLERINTWELKLFPYSGEGATQHLSLLQRDGGYIYDGYRGYHPVVMQKLGDKLLVSIGDNSEVLGLIRINASGTPDRQALSSEMLEPSAENRKLILKSIRVTEIGDYYYLKDLKVFKNQGLGVTFDQLLTP